MTILNLTLLLSSIGDWIDANPAATIALVVQFITLVIWLSKLEWSNRQNRTDMNNMDARIESHENGLHVHLNDRDAHVNQLYIGSLAGRIDKLETTMEQSVKDLRQEMKTGHKEISDNIDTKFSQLLGRIK